MKKYNKLRWCELRWWIRMRRLHRALQCQQIQLVIWVRRDWRQQMAEDVDRRLMMISVSLPCPDPARTMQPGWSELCLCTRWNISQDLRQSTVSAVWDHSGDRWFEYERCELIEHRCQDVESLRRRSAARQSRCCCSKNWWELRWKNSIKLKF